MILRWALQGHHDPVVLYLRLGRRLWSAWIRSNQILAVCRLTPSGEESGLSKIEASRTSLSRTRLFELPFISEVKIWSLFLFCFFLAGLGGSVGCAVRLETRRSRVQPSPRSVTFFRGDWSWNIFYGHSLPSADSRRAVVSFWRKNVHNTG